MLFRDIVGHSNIKDALINTVKDGRISHAQLFFGPEGSGNLAMAIAYAQYIACSNKQEHDACGACPSCKKYQKLIHPDLHFVYPVGNAKETSDNYIDKWREALINNPYLNSNQWYTLIGIDNKQGGIHRNESNAIVKKLSFKTYEAEYKVMIIWQPETMNKTSANKLLKILEEPPPKTIFILVAQNTDQIITTILSRTQMIKIPRIDDTSMEEALKAKFELNEQKANEIAKLANGNYLAAQNLIESDAESEYNFEMFVKLMRLCYMGKFLDIYAWIDEMTAKGREKQKNFLSFTSRLIRENFILNYKIDSIVYMAENEKKFAKNFHPYINENNAFDIAEELNKAYKHIEMNAYNKLVFLDLAIKIMIYLKEAVSKT
jgi:DNA polymerase-3 subunit delta'